MNKGDSNKPFSEHDMSMLKEFYVCFDRPAFCVNFLHESDLDALDKALADTIAALNTGIKKQTDGTVFGKHTEGKVYFDNEDLRKAFGEIVSCLTQARILYAEAKNSGFFFPGMSGYAFHRDHQEAAIKVAVVVDEVRNRALEVANGVYAKLKMQKFPYIQTADNYKSIASLTDLGKVKKSKFNFWSLIEIIEIKPTFFGINFNISKMLEKLHKIMTN